MIPTRLSALALASLLAVGLAAPAHALECPWQLRFWLGVDTNGSAMVHSGQKCVFPMNASGTLSLKIVSRPKHGVVTLPNRSTIAYQAQNGYKGTDTFVFVATGKSQVNHGQSTITMTMKVD
ncbi:MULTISPECIES: Ig-like domain-containing protein [unclassified Mesorhizobium]|uniref:Ig-like domain-containing protein n=1 Tax=unclassified Mesorhizobium TaxID=325217 RepID=UPI0012E3C2B3|nr:MULTISPECIES: Ig-like domain-containing protein [unclassified Mesorhizobium]